MGVQPINLLPHIGFGGEQGDLGGQAFFWHAAFAFQQRGQAFPQARLLLRGLIRRSVAGQRDQARDFINQHAQNFRQPRAFRSAGLRQALQRCVEGFGHHRTARFFSRFIQLRAFSAQHTGQGQQGFGARRWGAGDARGQIQRQTQGLIEGGWVWCQAGARLFLALDVQRRGDIAALEDLPRRVAQRRFHRVKAIG